MDVLMEGTDIRKRYRTGEVEIEVLKGIDFQIFQGEFISLWRWIYHYNRVSGQQSKLTHVATRN